MIKLFRLLFFAAVGVMTALPAPIFAQSDYLSGEFWYSLDPHPHLAPMPDAESYIHKAQEALQEEIIFIFSGMLYGYTFTYIPGSAARSIPEQFKLDLRARIHRPSDIRTTQKYITENTVRMRVQYDLKDSELLHARAWSSVIKHSSGKGSGKLQEGVSGKMEAMREAVKAAVLAELRRRLPNRPHSAKGVVLLREVPRIVVAEGRYIATVETKVRIENIRSFELF